jgi:hypothetical protein
VLKSAGPSEGATLNGLAIMHKALGFTGTPRKVFAPAKPQPITDTTVDGSDTACTAQVTASRGRKGGVDAAPDVEEGREGAEKQGSSNESALSSAWPTRMLTQQASTISPDAIFVPLSLIQPVP